MSRPCFGTILVLIVAALFAALPAAAAETGTLLKADQLKAEPFRDANAVATLMSGDKVEILKRQGAWFRVKTAKGAGWVRMLSVRRGEAARASAESEVSGLLGLASGRAGTGKVVATTGIRGLNEEQLKAAKFSQSELELSDSLVGSLAEARKFADRGKLAPRKVDYLDAEQQPDRPSGAAGLEDLQGLFGGSSREEESAVGRQIAGSLLGAAPLVKNRPLQQYVNNVGRWTASRSERPDLQWHFGVIQSEDINAFAIPGGYVYVTQGLYRLLGNEADLAGVLGHEIGHVVRKHHLKALQQSRLLSLGGRLLSKQADENRQIRQLIGSGAEIAARSLDQQSEFEADRMGVVLAARAGYDPFGLPEVLQNIGRAAKDPSAVALLFKTHPLPDARLNQLGRAMADRFDAINGQVLAQRLYQLKR